MSELKNNLKIVNNAKNAQHPFHVLGSSKLPVFMSMFVGALAISIIIKLQNISNLSKFLVIGAEIMEPFFSVCGALPNTELPDSIIDSRILTVLIFILITI